MDDDADERGFLSESRTHSLPAARPPKTDKPHYHGHRDRLRERLRVAGAGALADYEILELLLFRFVPRADTKPRAKALLDRFGSLAEVLGAPAHLLAEVNGIGPAVAFDLKLVASAAERMLQG